MRVVRSRTTTEFARDAADVIAGRLHDAPASVLALPTGSTPVGLYAELVARSRRGAYPLAQARVFNLDEFCGVSPDDPSSYAAFLRRHLIDPLALAASQVRLLKGDAADFDQECLDYERAIAAAGGIDLCVLGLGANGHIAFNEPGSSWRERTHVAELAHSTRSRLEAQPSGPRPVPTHGITLGIQNVLEAREALLLVAGSDKQQAMAAVLRGVEDEAWPVTCLLRHRNLTVIELCDPAPPL